MRARCAFLAYLHCRTWSQIRIWIRTPNPMATLYCTETVQIAETQTQILIQTRIPNHCCTHFGANIRTRIRIRQCVTKPLWIRIPKPMTTLHYADIFTMHGVRFRFQSQLPTAGMGSQSECVPESVPRKEK